MLAKKRQGVIEELLRYNGAVTTKELMQTFSVSIETVRRDLLTMEQKKLLQRVHGGAVVIGETKPFRDLHYRLGENDDRKKELSATAARLVDEGDTIGIDAGSTALYFAQALKQRFERLTVVTYSLDVFELLCRHRAFRVFLCGGSFYAEENAFCGSLVTDALRKLHMQKVFLFPYAVSLQQGICDHQEEMYPPQQLLMNQGDLVYILADSSKFERKALLKISDMAPEYLYVTDSGLPEKLKELYTENNLKIISGKEDAL